MIEDALELFRNKLAKTDLGYQYYDTVYLVEIARRQFKSLRGFSFCRIHSYELVSGQELRTRQRRAKNVKRGYLKGDNTGVLSWDDRISLLKIADKELKTDVVTTNYIEGQKAKRYSLHPKLIRLLLLCFFDDDGQLVLPTSKVSKLKHLKSYDMPLKDDGTKVSPKLITELHKSALEKLDYSLINKDNVIGHIHMLKKMADQDIEYVLICLSLISTLDRVQKQGLSATDKQGIYSYPPAYKVTGGHHPRLVDRLPVQNLPKELKEKVYTNTECLNYDIKSSGMNMLEKLFRQSGLDSKWFTEYLNDPDEVRQQLIDKIGCNKKQVKKALQSVSHGAPFSSSPKTALGKAFDTKEQAKIFIKEIKGLKKSMKQFSGLIGDPKGCDVFKSRRAWKNAVGMTFSFTNDATFGQICSFLVMGLEQKFILTLIAKLPANIKVYTVLHDGFICSGEISEELIDEVKTECDLPHLMVSNKFIAISIKFYKLI
jgi:hypothetical protein